MAVANGRYDIEMKIAELACMKRITHIVDADGFILRGAFYPREMSVLRLVDNVVVRYEFKLPYKKSQLSEQEIKSVNFVSDNIHGMRFSNEYWRKGKRRIQSMLPSTPEAPIHCLMEMAAVSGNKNCLFAYKGGSYERQWLERASIPSINLECFGCPRFDLLLANANRVYYQASQDSTVIPHYLYKPTATADLAVPCDMHIRRYSRHPPYRAIHCPASECRVFAVWVRHRMEQLADCLAEC